MRAFKCDRCKGFYEPYSIKTYYSENVEGTAGLVMVTVSGHEDCPKKRIELCEGCAEDFKTWLDEDKPNEENGQN